MDIYTNHDSLVGSFKYNSTISEDLILYRDIQYDIKLITDENKFSVELHLKKIRVKTGAITHYKIYYRRYNKTLLQWSIWSEAVDKTFYVNATSSKNGAQDTIIFTNSEFVLDDTTYGSYSDPPLYQFRVDFFDGFDIIGKFENTELTNLLIYEVESIDEANLPGTEEFYVVINQVLNPNMYDWYTTKFIGQIVYVSALSTYLYITNFEYTDTSMSKIKLTLSLIPDTITIGNTNTTQIVLDPNYAITIEAGHIDFIESAFILLVGVDNNAFFKTYPYDILDGIYALPFTSCGDYVDTTSYYPELPNSYNPTPIILNDYKLNLNFYLPVISKTFKQYYDENEGTWYQTTSSIEEELTIILNNINQTTKETTFAFLNNLFYDRAFIKIYIFIPNNETISNINQIDFYPTNNSSNGTWYFKEQISLGTDYKNAETKYDSIINAPVYISSYERMDSTTTTKYKFIEKSINGFPKNKPFYIWLGIGFYKPANFNNLTTINNLPVWQ